MLTVKNLAVHYGGLDAVRGIDLNVEKGEIVALIGCNAAGKSSTIRAISGTVAYTGEIEFKGLDLRSTSADQRVDLGIIQIPEGRKLFRTMTVLENLEMGAYPRRARANKNRNLKRVLDTFPRLYERRKQMAGSLSGGEQQMCAIGRGLMADPELLMLDEPTLGLAPVIVLRMLDEIKAIRDGGVTILLVEQNVVHTLRLSDRAYVLKNGCMANQGTAAELTENPDLKEAYLGH